MTSPGGKSTSDESFEEIEYYISEANNSSEIDRKNQNFENLSQWRSCKPSKMSGKTLQCGDYVIRAPSCRETAFLTTSRNDRIT